MPATTPRAQSTSWIGSIGSLLTRIWNGHRLFVIVMIPAALLRADAELGYRWQVWFNDSFDYVQNTVRFNLDPTRPSGYSIVLKILQPFHSYLLITILQHLMGLAVGVMVYALARHRFRAPAWLASLATVPVLYDGFEIQLEHLILSDVPFLFVLTLAVTMLLWSRPAGEGGGPSLLTSALIGLLLGIGAVLRSVGLPLLAIFAVYMIIRRVSWRRVAALIVLCVVPVISYAGLFDIEHGQFAMTDSTGVFLYSRVMTFAECSKMHVPVPELSLCTTVPPSQRPIAQAYIWTPASPLNRFPPTKFSPLPNTLAKDFAIRAIEAQPLDYVKTVWHDTWMTFGFTRHVFPNGPTYNEYLFLRHPLPIAPYNMIKQPGRFRSYAAVYIQGNPYTQVAEPFAGVIRLYERHVYLPGTFYGLILLIGLGGMVLAWRRIGGEALLPWGISVAMIVIPAATAEFDYRYVLPAVPFACLAAVLAFSPGTAGSSWLRRLSGGQRVVPAAVQAAASGSSSGSGPGSGSGSGPAGSGDDERDLASDNA